MVREYKDIKLDPRVQVVMHMDGWGAPWLKFDSYKAYIVDEPVQFTGFKLFYKQRHEEGRQAADGRRSGAAEAATDLHPVPVTRSRRAGA